MKIAPCPDATSPVRVLARGLAVLRVFAPGNPWMSNHEIARATGLPRSTTSRLTTVLCEGEYLEYSHERAQYRLALGALNLGYAAMARTDVRDVARTHLQKLASAEDSLVALGTRNGAFMVCHDVYVGDSLLTVRIQAGSRLPLTRSAMGRALAGSLPGDERDALLAELRKTDPAAHDTLQAHLADAIEQMQTRHSYISLNTLGQQINGIATVLDLPHVPDRYVFGLTGPSFVLTPELLTTRTRERLLQTRADIERDLKQIQRADHDAA